MDDAPADDAPAEPTPLTRRAALKVLGVVPLAAPLALAAQARPAAAPAHGTTPPPARQAPRAFFTAHEHRTVSVLADDIIPRDARSGSATDAKVPEFLDFNLAAQETSAETRTAWRGGLRWLDGESRRRFGVAYAAASAAERHQILDDIAWPERERPELRPGAAFFTRARDLIAAGFFSSALGYADLRYQGNTFVPAWTGCPDEALRKLGVSYDLMANTNEGR